MKKTLILITGILIVAVMSAKIKAGIPRMEKGQLLEGDIADDSITADKIADDAVTTSKILDGAVTPAKLDRPYVEEAGDTMTGTLTVPLLRARGSAGVQVSSAVGGSQNLIDLVCDGTNCYLRGNDGYDLKIGINQWISNQMILFDEGDVKFGYAIRSDDALNINGSAGVKITSSSVFGGGNNKLNLVVDNSNAYIRSDQSSGGDIPLFLGTLNNFNSQLKLEIGGDVKVYQGLIATTGTFTGLGVGVTAPTSGLSLIKDSEIVAQGTDANDTGDLCITAGGACSSTRGAYIDMHGNEDAQTGIMEVAAGNVAGGDLRLRTQNTTRVHVDYNGNVGVGTESPLSTLSVVGDASISGASTFGSSVTVVGNAFSVGASTFVVTEGMVGIGTASPDRTLLIGDGTGTPSVGVNGPASGSKLGYNIEEVGARKASFQYDSTFKDLIITNHSGGNDDDIQFDTKDSGVYKMVIKGSGEVGVGTVSPATKLDVNGDAQFGSGVAKATMTATGFMRPVSKTIAELEAITPVAGDIAYCSNCLNAVHVVVGTGTISGFDSFTGGTAWH